MAASNSKPLPENIPAHVAIIMDGNGRWAKQRGLPRVAGHRAGTENLRRVIEACVEFGIRTLTIYAFSTENWRRPAEEVNGLMTIFEDVIDRELPQLNKNGVQLRHIGKLEGLKPAFAQKVREAIQATSHNSTLILNVAFNYGGRSEIVEAVRRMVAEGLPADSITEEALAAHLYTGGQADPDLIIRTSGEMRVSNFLIWQGAYSEYYVAPAYWPDFDKEQLRLALEEYANRNRRFGGL
ncbi:MAG: isoprenyl transferase [Chloroflexi bacterium]|nr:isoprenyl transferase [Chloroflexota bacterium]